MELESLFGSRTRVKLLRLFFRQPDQPVFVREISRAVGEQINSVRRELANLEAIGLISSSARNQKKYYQVEQGFPLYTQLRDLVVQAGVLMEQESFEPLRNLDSVFYLVLAGHFVHDADADIDVFVVGDVAKTKMEKLLSAFQQKFGTQLRFTMMTQEEFVYRKNVTDKFVHKILNANKIVLVDRLGVTAT